MKKIVIGSLVLLGLLHQDFWFWNDIEPLVFGFVPIGLAYHIGVSIAAGILWALAVHYCWPADVDVAEHESTPKPEGYQPARVRS